MKVLVVGSGGREAAMVWKLAQSPEVEKIFCAPGNAGIAEYAQRVFIKATDTKKLLSFAKQEEIDLTLVGPEAPLVAGITDIFRKEHLLICGPSQAAAMQTEGSKVLFKKFLERHNIPTAPFAVFDDYTAACRYVKEYGARNIVIKSDELAGGKGVVLPEHFPEAERTLDTLLKGNSGKRVVIEDRLCGVERSVMASTDGKEVFSFPLAQDYKRAYDGGKGPNTGGMGAHTLALSKSEETQLKELLQTLVAALAEERCLYSGFIYPGVMMTEDGPRVLECNCRLGDPEAQVILPSIDGDFAELCMAMAEQDISYLPVPRQVKRALCLVLASEAYPRHPSINDDPIIGIREAEEVGALVFHAGTERNNETVTTNRSGRVLNVVGVSDTFTEARSIAYAGAEQIYFPGMRYHKDIGG